MDQDNRVSECFLQRLKIWQICDTETNWIEKCVGMREIARTTDPVCMLLNYETIIITNQIKYLDNEDLNIYTWISRKTL